MKTRITKIYPHVNYVEMLEKMSEADASDEMSFEVRRVKDAQRSPEHTMPSGENLDALFDTVRTFIAGRMMAWGKRNDGKMFERFVIHVEVKHAGYE